MYKSIGKRIFDIVFSLLGIIVCFPLFIAVAILIKLDSQGPVFFTQKRMGRNARLFSLLKFRTMFSDNAREKLMFEPGGKSKTTRVGAFLRLTKIDELPQLMNVFMGNLSFVGPRPEVQKYQEFYTGNNSLVLTVRPGVTDMASIKYKNEEELLAQSNQPDELYEKVILPDKLRINLKYIEKGMTLKNDIFIILKTLAQFLLGVRTIIMTWKSRTTF